MLVLYMKTLNFYFRHNLSLNLINLLQLMFCFQFIFFNLLAFNSGIFQTYLFKDEVIFYLDLYI